MRPLSGKNKKFLAAVNAPFAFEPRPFLPLADTLRVSEKDIVSFIRDAQRQGIVRRLGVVLGHTKVGFTVNALVAWQAAGHEVDRCGRLLAEDAAVSHCYARRSYPHWPYNLYTMVHTRSRRECSAVLRRLSRATGLKTYQVLTTLREHKKIKSDVRALALNRVKRV